jgi:hypothetical protein
MFGRFLWAIWDDWWALMGGAAGVILSVLAAGFGIAGWYWPSWAILLAGTVCIVLCSYRAWKKDRLQLDSLLETTLVFSEERMRYGSWEGHYSVAIENVSKTRTVRNCQVTWDSSVRKVEHMPIILHRSGRTDFKAPEGIDLAPGQTAVFDYLRIRDGKWEVVCARSPDGIQIPPDEYEVHLMATGEDVSPVTQTLVIKQLGTKDAAIFIKSGEEIRQVAPK